MEPSTRNGSDFEDLRSTHIESLSVMNNVENSHHPIHKLLRAVFGERLLFFPNRPEAIQAVSDQLDDILSDLSEREALVIRRRFGLNSGETHTLRQIGLDFSVSVERIRQIEAKALRKLRHPTRSRRLRNLPGIQIDSIPTKSDESNFQEYSEVSTKSANEYVANARQTYPRAYELWSQEEEAYLTWLFSSGLLLPEMAKTLGRQPNAIRIRLQRLGLLPKPQ